MSGVPRRVFHGVAAAAALALGVVACAGPGQDRGSGAGSGAAIVAAAPAAARGGPPSLTPSPRPASIGVVERFAWQTVEQLGEALATGDTMGFLGKVSNGFYKGFARLDASLTDLVARSSKRAVVVAVRDVTVDGERVSVRAEWTTDFAMGSGERLVGSGETTFLFLKNEMALRLLDYRGDAPFGIPGI